MPQALALQPFQVDGDGGDLLPILCEGGGAGLAHGTHTAIFSGAVNLAIIIAQQVPAAQGRAAEEEGGRGGHAQCRPA